MMFNVIPPAPAPIPANRALALVSAFVCHTVALAGLTWVGVWGLAHLHGVPVFAR